MPGGLWERQCELDALLAAVGAARSGSGSVVLVTGEAGIGKSSLIRAFLGGIEAGVRVLVGACDDLLAPRALGPLRDAARGTGGPLDRALAGASDAVFGALHAQLAAGPPTVLVVEDVQWADDATLDVLRYLSRRIGDMPAALVLSIRDEEVGAGHPVQELLGALSGRTTVRLPLSPLSPAAVTALADAAGRDGAAVYGTTGGNPFFVTETLATPHGELPGSVADAVLARMRGLGPDCIDALQQLSVVPTHVDFPLAEALLGERIEALALAEELGIVEVREQGLAFRHELARRAVESGLPRLRCRALNQAVVQALRETKVPDVERLVHHAVAADDVDTVAEFAPRAGRDAALAGSHRQALSHLEVAVAHIDLLAEDEQARLTIDYSWELYTANRLGEAVAAGRDAVRRCEEVGDPVLLGEALLALSRHVLLGGDSEEAEELTTRAVELLSGPAAQGDPRLVAALAWAATYHGATLTLTGQAVAAEPVLRRAMALAVDAARPDLESLCLNYLGFAVAELGEPAAGEAHLREALALALATDSHEAAVRAYANLGEMLTTYGDWDAVAEIAAAGLTYAEKHGMRHFTVILDLQHQHLALRRGAWDDAERGLHALVERMGEPNMIAPFVRATYGRLLARRGRVEAGDILERAWRQAIRMRQPLGMSHAGRALVEWAWLTGNQDPAREVAEVLLPRMRSAAWSYQRGELLRYLARAGMEVEPFEGCPEGYAAGLRGDWRAAAAAWERAGDGYERALEMGWSGDVEATLDALRVLDDLGAQAPAIMVRRRLRELGVTRSPRRRPPATRANPAGLTDRQLDVLELLGEGATNAQIAARLVLSVRTVDHHVAAILARLGARTRREAVAAARALEGGDRV